MSGVGFLLLEGERGGGVLFGFWDSLFCREERRGDNMRWSAGCGASRWKKMVRVDEMR